MKLRDPCTHRCFRRLHPAHGASTPAIILTSEFAVKMVKEAKTQECFIILLDGPPGDVLLERDPQELDLRDRANSKYASEQHSLLEQGSFQRCLPLTA